MSDITTLRASLRAISHKNSPYVDAAISDAIQHVRNEILWFNGDRHAFVTEADRYEYELPKTFLGIRGKVRAVENDSTTSTPYVLSPMTADELEDSLYAGTDYDSQEESGVAGRYAIDLLEKKILIGPIPSTAGDRVYFKFTADLGTPTYTMTTAASSPPSLGSVVTLLNPDGEALAATFTNAWFKQGFKLVRERALFELLTTYEGGSEETGVQAQLAMTRYLEELNRLRGETNQIQSGREIRKHL